LRPGVLRDALDWFVSLRDEDRRLIALVDAATGRAADAAGQHLACRAGCSPCCFGPFAITQLDAWRLREGLAELEVADPERAAGVRQRADAAVLEQSAAFPSDRVGTFASEHDEERFYAAFDSAPCPALDPDTGACVVYRWRPIACRTYGPPVRIAGDDLPPCPLCFKGATPEEVERARQDIDVGEVEDPLTDLIESTSGHRGMTTVAFAIGSEPATS